jgi:hypothetical protein
MLVPDTILCPVGTSGCLNGGGCLYSVLAIEYEEAVEECCYTERNLA